MEPWKYCIQYLAIQAFYLMWLWVDVSLVCNFSNSKYSSSHFVLTNITTGLTTTKCIVINSAICTSFHHKISKLRIKAMKVLGDIANNTLRRRTIHLSAIKASSYKTFTARFPVNTFYYFWSAVILLSLITCRSAFAISCATLPTVFL